MNEHFDLLSCVKCQGDLNTTKDGFECLNCSQKYILKKDIAVLLEDHIRV